MKSLWISATFLLTVFAGCSGADPEHWSVSHSETNEQTRITIESVPRGAPTYDALDVAVNGRLFQFGEFASFDDRRFSVSGKRDEIQAIEAGDMILVPGSGRVNVRLTIDDRELAAFEATIPDNRAPAAPIPSDPEEAAEGVSNTPTFRWSMVTDPAGVSYTLVYSLDPSMQIPALTTRVERLAAPSYEVPPGKELLAGMRYYWHVQAVDGSGNASPWSQPGGFDVAG